MVAGLGATVLASGDDRDRAHGKRHPEPRRNQALCGVTLSLASGPGISDLFIPAPPTPCLPQSPDQGHKEAV